MRPREWLRAQPLQALVLWTLAVVFVGFALADVPLLGLDPPMLAIMAAVFAALTASYQSQTVS